MNKEKYGIFFKIYINGRSEEAEITEIAFSVC